MSSIFFAFKFFSRIPLGTAANWNAKQAAKSLGALPLTGFCIGAIMAGVFAIMKRLGFPETALLTVGLLLLVEVAVGGALFLDGFADSCDGLFSGADREKTLIIMKDSRIGALGALGIGLLLLLKVAVLAELYSLEAFWRVLVCYPVWARWWVSYNAYWQPSAKPDGLLAFFKENRAKGAWWAGTLLMLGLMLVLLPGYWPAFLGSAIINCLVIKGIQNRLGGQTGDTCGFLAQVAELSLLLMLSMNTNII